MRILLRLFLGFALLFGGVEFAAAGPQAPASCCCGDEATCPCPPPPAPSAPRCPTSTPGLAQRAPALAPARAEQGEAREEAHPCPPALVATREEAQALEGWALRAEARPSPPDTGTRLALLRTFRN